MPDKLYHGSVRKIVGEKFIPKEQQDLEQRPENLHKAVYATTVRDVAIAMAIISCKGVYGAGLKFKKKPYGIIYDGWPKQKYVYLYVLPTDSFVKAGENGKQWASSDPVKPLSVERIVVEDHLDLVRKASKKEVDKWLKKYNFELVDSRK